MTTVPTTDPLNLATVTLEVASLLAGQPFSAARSAADSAADSAARSALRPTVELLQASALDLLNAMIDPASVAA